MRASTAAVALGMAVGLAFVGSCGIAAASTLVPLRVQEVVIPGGLQTHVPALAAIAGPTPTMMRESSLVHTTEPVHAPSTYAPSTDHVPSPQTDVNDNLSLGTVFREDPLDSAPSQDVQPDASTLDTPSTASEPVVVPPEVPQAPAQPPAPPAPPAPPEEPAVAPTSPDVPAADPPQTPPSQEPTPDPTPAESGAASAEPDPTPAEPSGSPTANPPAPPAVVGQMYTTAAVNLRAEPSMSGTIVRVLDFGTQVDVTGVIQGDWTQVLDGGVVRWIHSDYLATTQPTPPVEPTYLYTSADVNFRTGPGLNYSIIRLLLQATRVEVIGESGDWAQVIYSGTTGWVSYRYLQETAPGTDLYGSVGLNGVSPNITAIVAGAQGQFPLLHVFYGIRANAGEHTLGRAVDIMLPDYLNNRPLGSDIALYFQQHASQYNIEYIIWYQRIWFPGTSYDAWQQMEDRGSDTQNHRDHVHITVYS